MNTLAGFLTVATTIYKIASWLVLRIQAASGGKVLPAWVQQLLVVLLGVGAAVLFQMNGLPLIAQTFGGNLATVPVLVAQVLTGVGIAAVADGAVATATAALAAISRQSPPAPPSAGLW